MSKFGFGSSFSLGGEFLAVMPDANTLRLGNGLGEEFVDSPALFWWEALNGSCPPVFSFGEKVGVEVDEDAPALLWVAAAFFAHRQVPNRFAHKRQYPVHFHRPRMGRLNKTLYALEEGTVPPEVEAIVASDSPKGEKLHRIFKFFVTI